MTDLYKAPVSATVVVVVDPGVVGAGVVVTQLGGVQYPVSSFQNGSGDLRLIHSKNIFPVLYILASLTHTAVPCGSIHLK